MKKNMRAGSGRMLRATLAAAIVLGVVVQSAARAIVHPALPPGEHGVDWPMNDDPRMPDIPRNPVFHKRLVELWELALKRPEPGTRLQALQAMAVAKRVGMPNVGDLAPYAKAMLNDAKQDPAIHLSAARALVVMDLKDTGGDLLTHNRGGDLDMVLLTDPALARWKTAGAEELWMSRLKDGAISEQLLASAMRSLGVTANASAAEPLRGIVLDSRRSITIRAVAAESLALVAPATASETARLLAGAGAMETRLLAAISLPAKADAKGVELLVTLAQDAEPAVASVAVQKLLTAAPEALAPLAEKLTNHSDAIVRRNAVSVLQRHADAANIQRMALLLNDKAPRVREAAREALIATDAKEALRPDVRKVVLERLNKSGADDWRGIEQASLIVGSVNEVSARDRCITLLRHDHHKVRVAAVIGLRRLKLPDTLEAQFTRAREVAARYRGRLGPKPEAKTTAQELTQMDEELSQLNQNLGAARLQEARSHLETFIPKGSFGEEARTGAIWSLGRILEGKSERSVGGALTQRMMDDDPQNPEFMDVRVMSAISLGKMRDKSVLSSFSRTIRDASHPRLVEAAKWGTALIEGTEYGAPQAIPSLVSDWFLEPN